MMWNRKIRYLKDKINFLEKLSKRRLKQIQNLAEIVSENMKRIKKLEDQK